MQNWVFNLKTKAKHHELHPEYEVRAPIEGKKVIVQFDDVLPSINFEKAFLDLYINKLKKIEEERTVAIVSSLKRDNDGVDSKPGVYFKEFFFLGEDEGAAFEDEYAIIAYNKEIGQCVFERDNYRKEKNVKLPKVTSANIELLKKKKSEHDFVSLSLLDMVYLQNFRIFMKCDYKEERLDFNLMYPHLSFCLQEVKWPFKYCSVDLSQKLLQKKEFEEESKTFGFLTLDSNARILPLAYDDLDNIYKYPLIGVWIYGEKLNCRILEKSERIRSRVWGVLTHFLKNSKIKCRFSFTKNKSDFLLIGFNKGSQVKIFSTKVVDRTEMDHDVTMDTYRVDLNDESNFFSYNDKIGKQKNYFAFDFSKLERENHMSNLLKINKPTSYLSKKSQPIEHSTRGNQDMNNSQTIGVQTEQKLIDDSDFSVLNHLKSHQERTEEFYEITIKNMQAQINMLSQALISVNQNLAILNQQVVSSNHQLPVFGHQPSFQNEKTSNDTSKTFILPDITTKSLSISSNTLNLTDQTPKLSKACSEIYSEGMEAKRKRYMTQDSDIKGKMNLECLDEESIHRSNENEENILVENTTNIREDIKKEDSSDKEIFKLNEFELEEEEDNTKERVEFKSEVKKDIVEELNKINREKEFNINENNKSIPLARINPKFKNMVSSDSELSDNDDSLYKTAKQKYIN